MRGGAHRHVFICQSIKGQLHVIVFRRIFVLPFFGVELDVRVDHMIQLISVVTSLGVCSVKSLSCIVICVSSRQRLTVGLGHGDLASQTPSLLGQSSDLWPAAGQWRIWSRERKQQAWAEVANERRSAN